MNEELKGFLEVLVAAGLTVFIGDLIIKAASKAWRNYKNGP